MPRQPASLIPALAATFFTLLPTPPASAQDEPKTRAVEIRLLAFEYSNKIRSLHLFDTAAEQGISLEVDLPRYLSETRHKLALHGDKLVFSTRADRAAALQPGAAAATVTLPPKLRSVLLVFLPAPASDGGEIYRIMPLDDSVRGFPRGSIQSINMSAAPVRMMLEKKPYDVAPGKRILIENPPVRENNHTGVVVYAQLDGEWRRVASSLWPHPGKKRVFQIIYQHPATGRMSLKGFRDIAFDDPAP